MFKIFKKKHKDEPASTPMSAADYLRMDDPSLKSASAPSLPPAPSNSFPPPQQQSYSVPSIPSYVSSTPSKPPNQSNSRAPTLIDSKNIAKLVPKEPASSLRQFTWNSLSEAVASGELLIVGAGRYVYDISSWINVHPGGSVILNAAIGTDVTNDFFNEAIDFDKSSFVPSSETPFRQNVHNITRTNTTSAWFNDTGSHISAPESLSGSEAQNNEKALIAELKGSFLRKDDWDIILKARRTHKHSKLAVNKILNFMVGELVQPEINLINRGSRVDHGEMRLFDPFEYRRYALTKKTLLTTPGSTSAPVYLMRFCLIFPHSDIRIGEPEDDFRPGQGVELQAFLPDKTVQSIYLLPITGNTTCFEVIVKCTGKPMGQFLAAAKTTAGVKQYKIRGPFGVGLQQRNPPGIENLRRNFPSLRPSQLRMLQGAQGPQFNRLIFICAGIGIVPFLQILNESVHCFGKIVHAHTSYHPQNSDEMSLKPGDAIFVRHIYGDGWGYGYNVRTQEEGSFPASLIIPGCGLPQTTGAKFVVINCVHSLADIVGLQTIIPAVLAYPDMFEITHIVSSPVCNDAGAPPIPRGTIIEPLPAVAFEEGDILKIDPAYWQNTPQAAISRFGGNVEFGRLDMDRLERLVQPAYESLEANADILGHPDVVVCGPNDFEQMVYESLVDELGFVDHSHVTMMPPGTFAVGL
ncbi:hypothetical protein HK098_007585 [Nowakowskiella sp. JEL0407]|nr:hypothetical protein HK098_007585 [Nowakowskiella sp. JEL0407]